MEEQKIKNHPSLPSNYVTLAHLQQRWLQQKQQQQQKQDEEKEHQTQTQNQHQQQQDPHQLGDPAVVVPTNGTAPRSAPGNHRVMQYRPKNQTGSGTNRSAIARIRDQNAYLDRKVNKVNESKKPVKRNPQVKEKKEEEKSEAKSSTTETELNERNKKGKKKKKKKKKKKNDDSIVEQVEQKFGGLSINTENGKQNEKLKRVNGGFRHSQSQRRNDYKGNRGYGYGNGNFGGGFRRHNYEEQKRRMDKMVWVRKDGNVGGEIET